MCPLRLGMARLSTIRPTAVHKSVLYCPACKNPLDQSDSGYVCRGCSKVFPVIDDIPSFVDHREAVEGFDASAFEFLFEMEQKHFWHVGRREIILDVLRGNVPNLEKTRMLEIGCGNGNVLWYLKQNGINIEGGDIFPEGLNFCRKRTGSVALYQINIMALPFNNDFDVVGAFDVLEHVDDDEKALVEINRSLKTGGNLILTVPAHRFLWSYFDECSKHKRRYGKGELVAKLGQAGFTVKKVSYYMFFLFPLLAAIRLIGNSRQRRSNRELSINAPLEVKTVPVVNEVFLGLLRLEKLLLRCFNLPFGTSLLVLAEKR
jgi:SAM-dependent methyltransferase